MNDKLLELCKKSPGLKWFLEITKIPRGSGNERGISDFLVKFGKDRGLETYSDECLNVLITKPGQGGGEDKQPVAMQVHMDMVCVKTAESGHDFLKDPLEIIEEDGWIRANGTTLGADNGSSLGVILALLDDKQVSHPPIEALFTSEEETGMGGMLGFDHTRLKAARMINMDGAGDGVLCSSCAGGGRSEIVLGIERKKPKDGWKAYTIELSGLRGGHSGGEINKGRGNAIVLLARTLSMLVAAKKVRLADFKAGTKENVIPSQAEAVIYTKDTEHELRDKLEMFQAVYANELGSRDPGLRLEIRESTYKGKWFSKGSCAAFLSLIRIMPNGLMDFHAEMPDIQSLSSNIGVVSCKKDHAEISILTRGNIDSQKYDVLGKIGHISALFGAEWSVTSNYPAWSFRAESELRGIYSDVYKQTFGGDLIITAAHGGLESAIMSGNRPDMDIIAYGTAPVDVHSVKERIAVSSIADCEKLTANVLAALARG